MKALCCLLLLLVPLAALADERILSFHADILVRQDGWIDVTETTVVRAEGNVIRRGIVRDFPTKYRDRFGNKVVVNFEPQTALRNDVAENIRAEDYANGTRVYFGRSDYFLDHGVHRYEFRYRAGRMLGFYEDHDELYWNVTGLDSAFPVDKASADISFQFAVSGDELTIDAYTGRFGSTGKAYEGRISADGRAHFETTAVLQRGEGLTIAVSWPKGYVQAPTRVDRVAWLLKDNLNLLIALAGFLAMLAYYLLTWFHFGKDPVPGVVFTRYEPPQNFSPASLRYIEKMQYDQKVMTVAVVNLAVKGYLDIAESDDTHILSRQNPGADAPPLAAGEKALLEALFSEGNSVLLTNDEHELLIRATIAHKNSLKRDYANRYFRTNGLMNLHGIVLGVASMVVAFGIGNGSRPLLIAIAIAMVITAVIFAFLLRQPTGLGRKLLDELEGFREYLEIAEKDELNLRNPPEKTPQLFERLLPFALAIGVEQQWAEKFAAVFAGIRGAGGAGYQPGWYNGNWNSFDLASTTAALSDSLGSSISSAATPPGSSSGGGGGGFSGGGGGGGGTGGW